MGSRVRCIGVTGLNGAGKTTLAKFLCTHFFVGHYEVREFLERERLRLEMPEGRESLVWIANNFREKHGPEYIMKSLAENAVYIRGSNPFLIESVRCLGEVEYLSEQFDDAFVLIGVDAPPKVRYERVFRRGNLTTDSVSFERFLEQEMFEMNQQDPWKQNLSGCMSLVRKEHRIWNERDDESFLFDIARRLGKSLELPL